MAHGTCSACGCSYEECEYSSYEEHRDSPVVVIIAAVLFFLGTYALLAWAPGINLAL